MRACRAEITRGAVTLYCLKRKGHLGWHLNEDPCWDDEAERKLFEKAGKMNRAGQFRWPPSLERDSRTR